MSLFALSLFPKPFLKWVGGKTQLIPEINQLINQKFSGDQSFNYIEPFVGGGAVLFHILGQFSHIDQVIINDINTHLINAYELIKQDVKSLINLLLELEKSYHNLITIEEKKAFFLAKRREFNQDNQNFCQVKKTALLLFLNRTCFNGLYRVNKQGKFNVPFGKYQKPNICNQDNLITVNQYLQRVKILKGDFSNTLKYGEKPTLFYLDPPYKPINSTSAFTSYTQEDFNDQDQVRLKQFCDKIHQNGYYFILSNSDLKNHDRSNLFFDQLYQNYNIKRVKARRNINSKGDQRGELFELLISNF